MLEYSEGKDGLWRHKVQFDDGKMEELMLDSMPSSVMELVPDPNYAGMGFPALTKLASAKQAFAIVLQSHVSALCALRKCRERKRFGERQCHQVQRKFQMVFAVT